MKVKLSDVINRINGNVDRFTTELEYYVGGEHFDSSELTISRYGHLKPNVEILGFKFHFAFQERDVLFMARNPHLRKAGMVTCSGLCSDASYILRSKDEGVITQEFIAIQLQTDHFWEYCESHKVGSVNFAINYRTLAAYEFELPPIEIQKEISNKVWAAYRLKEAYKRLLVATDEMVKSQFIEMTSSCNDSCKLSDLVELPIEAAKKQYHGLDTINYIDISSIDDGSKSFSYSTEYLFQDAPSRAQQCVKHGDILYSTVRPNLQNFGIITTHRENLVASSGFCVLRPKTGLRNFIMAVISSDSFTAKMVDKAQGGVFPAVNQSFILGQEIPCPPEETIQAISAIVRQADKSKFELKKAIEAIDQVIKSLING